MRFGPNYNQDDAILSAIATVDTVVDGIATDVSGISIDTLTIKQFAGTIYYVDATQADDTGAGTTPSTAKKTITAAITAASAGDMIVTKAGTYTEDVDFNKNSLEFHPEIGTIITGQSADQALKISGNYCKIVCEFGTLRVNPIATKTGVVISGNWNYINNVRVPCGSSANIGFDITGDGNVLYDCRCSAPLVAAFKVQGDKVKIWECCTGGNAGDSSIGFWFTNSCDKARVKSCGSQGHETGGFQVDTGCTNGVIESCYSGGGDGKSTDADNSFVWSNFFFETEKFATQTFAGGGGGSTNLFKVTGSVEIIKIWGHVTTVLAADVGNLNLEFDDGAASVNVTGTVDVSSAPVGSLLLKDDTASNALDLVSSANAAIVEQPAGFFTGQQPIVPFILVAKAGATNYITSDYAGNAASGVIHWHIEWRPLTDDGFVEVA